MAEAAEAATTLRDDLSAQFDALEQQQPATPAPAPQAQPVAEPVAETAEQKAGRTAGRARDEQGKLLPGKAVKPAEAPAALVAAAPATPAPKRPSSWKKEHWADYDNIAATNPPLAAYLNQREQEYSQGVSTYKNEWDRAKPLIDAIAPFQQTLDQHGIKPDQWISNLGNAHMRLAKGSPQDKLGMMQKLVSDYGVPAQLAVQDAQGQWQLLGQYQPPAHQQQQAPQFNQQQLDQLITSRVNETLQTQSLQQQIAAMEQDTQKYPHFSTVRSTMGRLLDSGEAETLSDAYDIALRLPRHAEIYEAQQQQQREQDAAKARETEQARVNKARANNVSPRTSTPSGAAAAMNGKKSLREELSEQFDAHTSGRV